MATLGWGSILSFRRSVYSLLLNFVMKTLAYLDCPTGISGDMCLGALVHAGVPLGYLEDELAKLGIGAEFALSAEAVQRNQQAATKVHVKLLKSAHTAHSHEHTRPHLAHEHAHLHSHHAHEHAHDHSAHDHSAHDHPAHDHPAHGRRLPEIEALIQQADIPERAAKWSLAVFHLLAKAEATVHGIPAEKVHFHEVGATDAIVDIVGTCLGLDWLDIDEIVCSSLPTGGGTVRCEHGLLPVPAPAVLSMMATARIPVYGNDIKKELVTPTGCAIAATLAASFGPPPAFTPKAIGLGAGGRDLEIPNILRLWIGTVGTESERKEAAAEKVLQPRAEPDESKVKRSESRRSEAESLTAKALKFAAPEVEQLKIEEIVELQTQIDDCSPQAIAHASSLLFDAGAVDVFSQSVAMKKNRLGTLLTVLCPQKAVPDCETVLYRETTTLGIRRTLQNRSVLLREMKTVRTEYGEIDVKVARASSGSAILNIQPEYDDCVKAAQQHRVPFAQVQQSAQQAAMGGDRAAR